MALAKPITGPPLEKLEIDLPEKLKKVLIPLMELVVQSENFHSGHTTVYDIKEMSEENMYDNRSGYYHASLHFASIHMDYEGETIISDGATLLDIRLMITHALLCENSSARKMLEQAEEQNLLRVIAKALVQRLKLSYKET